MCVDIGVWTGLGGTKASPVYFPKRQYQKATVSKDFQVKCRLAISRGKVEVERRGRRGDLQGKLLHNILLYGVETERFLFSKRYFICMDHSDINFSILCSYLPRYMYIEHIVSTMLSLMFYALLCTWL